MRHLTVINTRYGTKKKYLGIRHGYLLEILDSHPSVNNLLPESVKYRTSDSVAYRGRYPRLVVSDYQGSFLAIIRNCRAISNQSQAELVFYLNNSNQDDITLLRNLKTLASFRWEKGKLSIKSSTFKKLKFGLKDHFIAAGWNALSTKCSKFAFEIQL